MRIWRLNGHQLPEMPSLGHGLTCRRHVRYLGLTQNIDEMTWNGKFTRKFINFAKKFFEKLWVHLYCMKPKYCWPFFENQVVEVAIHWGDDSEYELQSKVDGIWTTVASNVGVAGETVRNVLSEAADTQWIRIKCSGSCVIKEVFVYEAGDGTTEIGGPPTDILANRNEPVSVHASSFSEDGLKVIDGNLTTQWTSSPGDQWIWLDLKGSYELDHVARTKRHRFFWEWTWLELCWTWLFTQYVLKKISLFQFFKCFGAFGTQVVVSWGSKMPSSFDIDMSFIPAEYWDLLVADVIPTSGDQFIHFPTGTTTQWVRVHCKGATEGCSIAELQAEPGCSFLSFRVVSGLIQQKMVFCHA